MEKVEFPGYTKDEKIEIASVHLVPKQLERNGLAQAPVTFLPEALRMIIEKYTREGGVRNLERLIRKVLRKIAARIVREPGYAAPPQLRAGDIPGFLGLSRAAQRNLPPNGVGVATGLAVASDIGEGQTMRIEIETTPGQGALNLRSQFGPMFRDSIENAITYLRVHSKEVGVDPERIAKLDWHVNVAPAGPKESLDGPSAGVALWSAVASQASGRPVRKNVAMTGEVSLKGRIGAVGGIAAKVIAAAAEGNTLILVPAPNEADVEELSAELKPLVRLVSDVSEVLELALEPAAPPAAGGEAAVP